MMNSSLTDYTMTVPILSSAVPFLLRLLEFSPQVEMADGEDFLEEDINVIGNDGGNKV